MARRHALCDRSCVAALGLLICACAGSPADTDLSYHRGLTALAEGQADLAAEYFEADLAAHPERSESMSRLALAWLSSANPPLGRAAEILERYLEQRPEDVPMQVLLVDTLLRDGAIDAARERLAFLDQSLPAQRWRVNVLMHGDLDAAADAAEDALAQHPDDPLLLEQAAEIALRRRQTDRATELAQRAVQAGSTRTELHYLLLRLARMTGRTDEIPLLARTHESLSRLMPMQNQEPPAPEERVRLLTELERDLPAASTWARVHRAAALIEAGMETEATAELERLEHDPGLTDDLRLQLAGFAKLGGLSSWAERLYEQALEHDPGSLQAINGLTELALRAERFEEAERLARSGRDLQPNIGRWEQLLGMSLMGQQRIAEADPHLARSVELAPWQAEWRLRWLELLAGAGRTDEAARVLAQAPAWTPAFDEFLQRHPLALSRPTGEPRKSSRKR